MPSVAAPIQKYLQQVHASQGYRTLSRYHSMGRQLDWDVLLISHWKPNKMESLALKLDFWDFSAFAIVFALYDILILQNIIVNDTFLALLNSPRRFL